MVTTIVFFWSRLYYFFKNIYLKFQCNLLILCSASHVFPHLLAKNTLSLFAESLRLYHLIGKDSLFSSRESVRHQLSHWRICLGKTAMFCLPLIPGASVLDLNIHPHKEGCETSYKNKKVFTEN